MEAANILTQVRGDHQMSAIVQTEYGSTDVLKLKEVDKPVVADLSVLVRVMAASVNAGDWHLMRGTPFLSRLIFGGIFKPKIKILGFDIAGKVEAVGKDVTQFQPGDEVFGDLSESGFGAFAEYVCAIEGALVLKPATTTFEQAATVPGAALAALQGLRDLGQIKSGQKVLINGASGGVGSFAVQIAKSFGAEVTAICNTRKMAMVRSIGADYIIDYTQTDVTQTSQQYDIILDAAGYRSVFDYLPILNKKGTYVLIGGSNIRLFQIMFFGSLISRICRKTVKLLVSKPNQPDLMTLRELMVTGKITPYIDKCYSLREVPTAIRDLEQRQVSGKIAISV